MAKSDKEKAFDRLRKDYGFLFTPDERTGLRLIDHVNMAVASGGVAEVRSALNALAKLDPSEADAVVKAVETLGGKGDV